MLYLFGRLALNDSFYSQQEEEAFNSHQKTNGRRPEEPQPSARAAAADRHQYRDCRLPQASRAAASHAS